MRGGGGRTRRTGGTEGAGWRKRLEGVDDLEGGGDRNRRREKDGGDVRQNRWHRLTVEQGPAQRGRSDERCGHL